jgi:hypothetical protein
MNYSTIKRDVSRDRQREVPPAPVALARLWSRTSKLKELWVVMQAIGAWPGISIIPDRDGLNLSLHGQKLGDLRWNGRVDLPFPPEVGNRLVAEGMADHAPGLFGSGCVAFDVRTLADTNRAVWLLRLAYVSVDQSMRSAARS